MTVYKIGRSYKSDIVLEETSVSREHAELVLTGDGRYHLTDCGSTYGTFISQNGKWKKIRQAFVGPNDVIMLGKHQTSAKAMMDVLSTRTNAEPTPQRKTGEHSSIRKLAAILAADVVGYSSLMGADESGTLKAFKQCRKDLFDPKVEEFRGRIFKVIGDGILCEFNSVVDAVRCALDIQTGMVGRTVGQDPEAKLVFRIGINLGDVIVDGDDIYGDGVNIAARLEGLSEPGGICVSGPVYDQIKNKLDLGYEDQGAQQVKNIAEPVRTYRIYATVSGRVIPS